MDFQKFASLCSLKFHFLLINRAGRNLSADKIGNLLQVQEVYGRTGRILDALVAGLKVDVEF